jgi:hypothetical protein
MMPAATWPLSARDGLGAAITVIAAVAIAAITAGNLVMVYPLLLHTKLGPAQSLAWPCPKLAQSNPTSEIRPNGGVIYQNIFIL